MTNVMEQFEKMTEADIAKFVTEKRELIQSARFGTGSTDVKAQRAAKRDIARALTALRMRAAK